MPIGCFPGLAIDWRLFRRERLREVSGFSVFMLLLDAAYKVNYSTDVLVIGAWLGAPAVALWAPAQRLSELTLRLSNQLSEALFPIVVDCDASQRAARLRKLFVHGTRLSLATVLPVAGGLALLAHPLLMAWIGPSFATTATIVQILAFVVIVRVGSSTASVVLKGAGLHRRLTALVGLMAVGNLALSIALRALARARRRGARHGGAGDARRRLWSVPDGVPACRDVVRRDVPEGAVAGAVAGCRRRCRSSSSAGARFPRTLPAVALQFAIGAASISRCSCWRSDARAAANTCVTWTSPEAAGRAG